MHQSFLQGGESERPKQVSETSIFLENSDVDICTKISTLGLPIFAVVNLFWCETFNGRQTGYWWRQELITRVFPIFGYYLSLYPSDLGKEKKGAGVFLLP